MLSAMIDFTNVLLAALLVGAMFGVWLFLNPTGSDAVLYVALQQQGIQVTRRTVAKYREDMNIPSTHQRRVKK